MLGERDLTLASKRASRHAIGIRGAQMKKELLKGFSLLALIIVLALMTAVASVSANAPTNKDEAYTAVAR